jgi:hypothetical protein
MVTIPTALDTHGLRQSYTSMVEVSTHQTEIRNRMRLSQLEVVVQIQQDIRPIPAVRIVQWTVLLLCLQKSPRRHMDSLDLATTLSTYLLAVGWLNNIIMEDRYSRGMGTKTRGPLHCHARRAPLEFQSSWEQQAETPNPRHRDLEQARNAGVGLGSALASPKCK